MRTEDALPLPDLPAALEALLGQVPPGRVTTYGALAAALGDPIAARWVGSRLLNHPHGPGCACHRVVQATGELGRFVEGVLHKRRKLEAEGVRLVGERVNLIRYGFATFAGERPLAALRALQRALTGRIVLSDAGQNPRWVAGVDVSYTAGGEGVAAYALVDARSARLCWSDTLRAAVEFPYISTYLAFRELPLHLALLARVRAQDRLAPLLLVDGTGVLHPRGAGIASHLGVLAGVPTIGVTKRPLCGEVNVVGMGQGALRAVRHGEREAGLALKSRANAKPIYLSPGHETDLGCVRRVVPPLVRGHRLPEPLYWADRLSRATARAPAGARRLL